MKVIKTQKERKNKKKTSNEWMKKIDSRFKKMQPGC
jgi:hypothetical protein